MTMRDRILLALSWSDLTYSEMAVALGHKRQSIVSANQANVHMSFVEPMGDPMNRKAPPVRWKITNFGRARLSQIRTIAGIDK